MLEDLLKNIPKDISTTEVHFNKGEVVYTLNDKGKFVHILVSGKTICQMDKADGNFIPLCIYEPYSMFGEAEIFSFCEQTAYIEALSNCITVKIDNLNFLKWIKQDFELSIFIMKQLSEKLLGFSQRTADFITMPLKDRVLEVIVRYHQNGCLEQLTKAKLCYSVSAPLRSVNRAIKSLIDENMIDYQAKRFYCL